jgi:hypothetical protein
MIGGREVGHHDWLTNHGKVRCPLIIYFSAVVHLLQLSIIFNWLFRHILLVTWVVPAMFKGLRFSPTALAGHPDGLFGFAAWENIANSVFNVSLCLAVVVVVWIAGQHQRKGTWWGSVSEPWPAVAAFASVILIPLVLILTLRLGHRELMDIKYQLLMQVDIAGLPADLATRTDLAQKPDWPIRSGARAQYFAKGLLGVAGLAFPEVLRVATAALAGRRRDKTPNS